ncbi:rhomboid family intramembrane serine protease [Stieleria varia]|uniref:Rhomboid protease GlpG n=1 Tax=Stieleria varia TaxID=2528005 RepID=A0A5C6A3I3_9BACT|nr:rhomboid family intramembrane serine protease [Stieleria varia]TWT94464.1 Rhomboid protease GlpG [Stieleria varia]
MRRIGTVNDPDKAQELAKRLADYLITLSIESSVDSDGQGGWTLWVRDEERVDEAKQAFAEFLASPDDPKFKVSSEASRIRDQRIAENRRRLETQRKLKMSMPKTRGVGAMSSMPGRQQAIPVTLGVVLISVILSFSTGFARQNTSEIPGQISFEEKAYDKLSFVDPGEYIQTGDAFHSVREGEVWRIFTPMFLHGDMFHLAFNMIALFMLGSVLERLHGSKKYFVLLMVSYLVGMAFQLFLPPPSALPVWARGLAGSPFSIGASGAVYGLFGFLWIRPMIDSFYPLRIPPRNVMLMLGWLVFCIFGISGIANGAHIGGLIAGVAFAMLIPNRFLSDSE